MIESDLSSLVIEEMQEGENKDKIFRLVWVQNLDTLDHQFRVLFKHIEANGKYLTTKIAPEQLFVYAPGAFYINGQRLQNPAEEGELVRISTKSPVRKFVKTAGEAFSDDLYDLRHDRVIYSKSQYCVVIEDDTHEVIFPCFVLGATYYFTSASMCRQLFAQSLNGLYEPNSLHVNSISRHAKIHLKTNAADRDAADIIRFATNKNANRQWHSIVNRLRDSQRQQTQHNPKRGSDTNVPLITDFPVATELTMVVRAVCRYYPKLGKEKILVLEIVEENSPFDFDRVTIERIHGESRTVDVKRRAKARRTTNIVTVRVPSSELTNADVKNSAPPKNVHKDNMIIDKEYETKTGKEGLTVPPGATGKGKADLSLQESKADGNPEVRHGEIKPAEPLEPEIRHKESFSLDDFQNLVNPLAKQEDVKDFQMVGPLAMPIRSGRSAKGSLWEFSDKEHKIRRKYLRVGFNYKSRSTCLIEINQNGLLSTTSTYVLTDPDGATISQEEILQFLDMFVKRDAIEAIEKYFQEQGLTFLRKKHPTDKEDEHYQMWRQRLLKRIEGVVLRKER
ncbi:MAG: hypothetical protein HZA17_04200 [Nitrospirae bacterium]|nr:hypothetical protein [Nitrospirota bacterium]